MKDIFGKSLHGYWKGDHRTPHAITRNDGYVDISNLEGYFNTKPLPQEVKALQFLHGQRVLDIGCGAGRNILYLQSKGLAVTGIDTSSLAIRTCKDRGCKGVKRMDIFKHKFSHNSFDSVILFGHNLGIGGTLPGVKKLLRVCKHLLRPGGVILLTSVDVTKTKKLKHQRYQRANRKAGRYVGVVKIRVEYKGEHSDWFNWVQVEPKVLKRLAKEIDLKIVKVFQATGGRYSAVLQKD